MFPIIVISCLGGIVYSNTLFCSFHFDDNLYIVDNLLIKNVHFLQNIWNYYPCRFVTFLTFAFDYHSHQLHVLGYHLFNITVHLISAILVWWLTLLTFSTPAMKEAFADKETGNIADSIALFAGLIFVSHPVQTEAVTYICQRAASLATLFYLLSLCLYVKSGLARDRSEGAFYSGSWMIALAAMFTKETAITLPLMILLYEFSFFKTERRLNWKRISPFLLTLMIIPLTMVLTRSKFFQEIQHISQGPGGIPPTHYFLTQFRVIVTYIRLAFLPFNQNLDYDYPVFSGLFELPVFMSVLFIISILLFAKRMFLKYRLVVFSIFWYFITLLPESSFLSERDVVFEHRLYLPLVGYSIFLATGLYYLSQRTGLKTMVIILMMIISCYSILTYQRNKVWKDEISLWSNTVDRSPNKARPYNNLGYAFYQHGDITQAIFNFNKAIALYPDYADAYDNLGWTYYNQGNLSRAFDDYNKAIELNPRFAKAYNNRGLLYYKQGRFSQAMADYNEAIAMDPDFAEPYNNRAIVFYDQGRFIQAMADYNKAISMDPDFLKAYNNRARMNYKQGNIVQALLDCNKAIEINPDYTDAYNNRGLVWDKQGDVNKAISDYTRAIELDPHDAQAFNNRAVSFYRLKDYQNAWKDIHKAEQLGYAVNLGFINAIKIGSGQDK